MHTIAGTVKGMTRKTTRSALTGAYHQTGNAADHLLDLADLYAEQNRGGIGIPGWNRTLIAVKHETPLAVTIAYRITRA